MVVGPESGIIPSLGFISFLIIIIINQPTHEPHIWLCCITEVIQTVNNS